MSHISEILAAKGGDVCTVKPTDTVLDAIQLMADKDIGSVMVVSRGAPVGIFTERHYARKVFLRGKASPTTRIRDVMESEFVHVAPTRTVEECMAIMSERKVRHLPVIEAGKLVGIVSIGDLVKSKIADQEFTIEQLKGYIRAS